MFPLPETVLFPTSFIRSQLKCHFPDGRSLGYMSLLHAFIAFMDFMHSLSSYHILCISLFTYILHKTKPQKGRWVFSLYSLDSIIFSIVQTLISIETKRHIDTGRHKNRKYNFTRVQTYSGTSAKLQQSDFSIIWRYIKQMELEKSKRKSIGILKLDLNRQTKKLRTKGKRIKFYKIKMRTF